MSSRIGSVFFGFPFSKIFGLQQVNFFSITSSGAPAEINVTLCLNAKGTISCQNYDVSAVNLSILTKINRTYTYAGIRVNTPFYSIANVGQGCTPLYL